MEGEADAMVGDAGLREVVRPDALAALAGTNLAAPVGRDRGLLLFLRSLEQPRLQDAHRLRAILDLRALVLARDDETGGNVRDADGRVRRIDALAPWPRRTIDVDADIPFLDPDLHVFRLRQHRDRDGRGVDTPRGFGHRHPLDAMDTAFELEPAPGAT